MSAIGIRNTIIVLIVLLIAIQGVIRFMKPLFLKYQVTGIVNFVYLFENTGTTLSFGILALIVILIPIYFYTKSKEKQNEKQKDLNKII